MERWTTTTLFYEYLELSKKFIEEDIDSWGVLILVVIQYGFVTMFLVAFPREFVESFECFVRSSIMIFLVAPLCAFLNNIVEIRIDAHKFVCDVRRPVAKKVADIGRSNLARSL